MGSRRILCDNVRNPAEYANERSIGLGQPKQILILSRMSVYFNEAFIKEKDAFWVRKIRLVTNGNKILRI